VKATLEFDLSNPEDAKDFETVSDAQDYKDAFQETWKYVRDQIKYGEGFTHDYLMALQHVLDRISKIAEENEVSVW